MHVICDRSIKKYEPYTVTKTEKETDQEKLVEFLREDVERTKRTLRKLKNFTDGLFFGILFLAATMLVLFTELFSR